MQLSPSLMMPFTQFVPSLLRVLELHWQVSAEQKASEPHWTLSVQAELSRTLAGKTDNRRTVLRNS